LRGVPAFSIYQGKQLLLKFEGDGIDEGATMLENFLPMLSQSAAIYTLCVYEEFTGKINDKTPYHGSWNFNLRENTPGYNQSGNMLDTVNRKLVDLDTKITQLSQLQIEKELADSEEDPVIGAMDKIGSVLGHPLVERLLPVILNALNIKTDNLQTGPTALPAPGTISGIGATDPDPLISADLLQAMNYMLLAAPETEKAFINLGEIARTNPKKFKDLLGYLKFI